MLIDQAELLPSDLGLESCLFTRDLARIMHSHGLSASYSCSVEIGICHWPVSDSYKHIAPTVSKPPLPRYENTSKIIMHYAQESNLIVTWITTEQGGGIWNSGPASEKVKRTLYHKRTPILSGKFLRITSIEHSYNLYYCMANNDILFVSFTYLMPFFPSGEEIVPEKLKRVVSHLIVCHE